MTNILPFPRPFRRAATPIWLPLIYGESRLPRRRPTPASPASPSLLDPLAGTNLLAVFDDDNIRISCQEKFGSSFSYRTVAEQLRQLTSSCEMSAVLTSGADHDERSSYFRIRGFLTLGIKREVVETIRGPEVKSNADFDLAFETAFRIAQGHFDTLLVGSGDGDLTLSIARGVQRLAPGVRVFTLSVPGCTSNRILQDRVPELIAGNFYVRQGLLRAGGRTVAQRGQRADPRKPVAARGGSQHVQ